MSEEQELQRKLTTILAADIVGYSTLTASDEDWTVRTLGEVRKVVDEIIRTHQGRIFNTGGDSVLAEFGSPVEAVRSAIDIQAAVSARNALEPDNRKFRYRIGVNLGDVLVRDSDLLGDGVNVAARLQTLAEPGGICISGTVWDHIAGKLTIAYVDLGDQFVKNIPRPIRAYHLRVGEESGGSAAPAPAIRSVPPSRAAATGTARPVAKSRRRIALYGAVAIAAVAAVTGAWMWRAKTERAEFKRAFTERLASVAPTMPEAARTRAVAIYEIQATHRAFAISTTDVARFWTSFARSTVENAQEAALEGCQVAYGRPCILVAVDNVIQSPQNNAWIAQDMPRTRYRGDFDPAQIPNGSPELAQRPDIAGYRSAPAFKAAAHHPGGLNMFIVTNATDQRAAEIEALQLCNDDLKDAPTNASCFLYAVGDRVVLPLRLKGPMTAAPPR